MGSSVVELIKIKPFDLRLPTVRAIWAGSATLAVGWLLLSAFPSSEIDVFSAGAARVTGIVTGLPTFRVEQGWMLPLAGPWPVVVSPACSASHYFLMISALLSSHLARRGSSLMLAVAMGLMVGFPLTLLVNALRILSVIQVYRWIVPHVLARRVPFLHTLTGVAVFLPCLISVNFLLEKYGHVFRAHRQQTSG